MENCLPKRKPTRLKGFDYSKNGAYFITICTEHRKKILSSIVGEGSPLPQLTACGKIAEHYIQLLSRQYPNFSVDHYVIMPNHIHLLLSADDSAGRGDPSPTVTAVIGWLKYQITKDINTARNTMGSPVFQRSFHDHIVRNHADYQELWQYIEENPLRWKADRFYLED